MLIEVVALQPPHHYEGVVTIHLKKLLAAEPGEVISVNSVCSDGFPQEKTYYCAKCGKSFRGDVSMLCFTPLGRAQSGRVKPPRHSITSSARASSIGGISRPSALAALRLTANSSFVGCCTGRSAGFSPLRVRSTYPAARRNWSTMSGPSQ